MLFQKLTHDLKVGCDCMKVKPTPRENVSDLFSRRIRCSSPSESDFLSYYELEYARSGNSCKNWCQHRAVSISAIVDASLQERKDIWRQVARFKPASRLHYLFRFKENAGRVWPTPTIKDPAHCDFFKSDDFGVNYLESLEVFDALA